MVLVPEGGSINISTLSLKFSLTGVISWFKLTEKRGSITDRKSFAFSFSKNTSLS